MKKVIPLVFFFLFIYSPSSAIDLQDLIGSDTNGYAATGLDKIRKTVEQNQNAMGDLFLQGIYSGGTQAPSPLKAIMDDFIMKGLANPYVQDTTDPDAEGDTIEDDLPFFSGQGTGLFDPPEEAADDPFAWPSDDWGWFYSPDDMGVWFDPGLWSEDSQ